MKLTFWKGIAAGAAAATIALGAGAALAGDGINGIFNLGVTNTVGATSALTGGTNGDQLRVTNTAGTDAANAVLGLHSAGAGTGAGVQGDTASTAASASGVYGRVTSTTSAASSAGVRGVNSGKGMGVFGSNKNNTPLAYGVYGEGRYGLVGKSLFGGASSGVWASSPNGFAGVEGHSGNANGFGVYGNNHSSGAGVYGTSTGGYGVWGNGTYGLVGGGTQGGVWATTSNPDGSGVYGQNTGGGRGIFGTSTTGVGVYGRHDDIEGTQPGVQGDTNSTADGAFGVLGRITVTQAGGSSAAVRGINNGASNGIGVWGSHAGSGWGVLGTSPSGVGVVGRSEQGYAFVAQGHTSQSITASGWVKAMVLVLAGQSDNIGPCFNSQWHGTSSTTGDCGILYSTPATSIVQLTFRYPNGQPIDLSGRFVSVMPVASGGDVGAELFRPPGADGTVQVKTFYSAQGAGGNNAEGTWAPFYVLVF